MIRLIPIHCARALVLAGLLASAWPGGPARATDVPALPSPVRILNRRELDAPFLDAVSLCVPADLEEPLDGVVEKAAEGDWPLHRGKEVTVHFAAPPLDLALRHRTIN